MADLDGLGPEERPRQPTSLQDFRARSRRVREACRERPPRASGDEDEQQQRRLKGRPPYPFRTLWVGSMAFCALAKTGTTFWKRVFFYLDQGLSGPLLSHDFGDVHEKAAYMLMAPR